MDKIRTAGKMCIIVIGPTTTNFPTEIADQITDLYDRGFERVLIDMGSVTTIVRDSVVDLLDFKNKCPDKPFCFFGTRRFIRDLLINSGLNRTLFFENERLASKSLVFQSNKEESAKK